MKLVSAIIKPFKLDEVRDALTGVGVGIVVVTPFPSWPSELYPQDQTVPSDLTAREWNRPPEMATTLASPTTWAGLVTVITAALPVPTSPSPL